MLSIKDYFFVKLKTNIVYRSITTVPHIFSLLFFFWSYSSFPFSFSILLFFLILKFTYITTFIKVLGIFGALIHYPIILKAIFVYQKQDMYIFMLMKTWEGWGVFPTITKQKKKTWSKYDWLPLPYKESIQKVLDYSAIYKDVIFSNSV